MDQGPVSSALRLHNVRVHGGVNTAQLRVGTVETFRVAGRTHTGLVRLLSSRFSVTARDGGILRAGAVIRLRLVSLTPDIRFSLERAPATRDAGRDVATFLRGHGIPADGVSLALVDAVLRSGRTPTAALIRHARDLAMRVRRKESIDRREARAILELADRGIINIDEHDVYSLISSSYRDRGESDHDRDKESHRGGEADSVREYLRRATDAPNSFIQLCNALAPTGDLHWIHVPIAARRGSARVDALLRVQWNLRASRAERAILQGGNETDGEFLFEIELPSAEIVRVHHDEKVPPEALEALGEFLSSLHSEAEPRTMGGDGFDLHESSFVPGSLDQYG